MPSSKIKEVTMGNQDTQVIDPTTGNPTVTPSLSPIPAPDPAVELAELRRKTEELGKQVADKDRFISDLANEKATLETKLTQRDIPPISVVTNESIQIEAAKILEKAQLDPEEASKDLAKLIADTTERSTQKVLQNIQANLQPAIENNVYAAEVKTKNKDVLDFFGEDVLSMKVANLIQSGKTKTFKEAVDIVIKEYRSKYDGLKSNAAPAPLPIGATGEEGGNRPPSAPPSLKEITPEEEIKQRQERRRLSGL